MPEDHIHRVRILQVSDLHIGIASMTDRFIIPKIGLHVEHALQQYQDTEPFDFIVVTGDLVDASDKCDSNELTDRYATADSEIRDIMQRTGITDKNRVIIIPGNQDVIRSQSKQYNPQGFDIFLDFINNFYGDESHQMGFTVANTKVITTNIKDSSSLFCIVDLIDSTTFAVKLRDAKISEDPLTLFFWEEFSSDIQEVLSQYDDSSPPTEELKCMLIMKINQLLQGPSLYDENRFAGVNLSTELQELIRESPEGEELIYLNRLLIEEAFPHEIASGRSKRLEYEIKRSNWCITTDKPVVFWPLYTASLNLQENRDGRLTDHEIQSGILHINSLRKHSPDDICIVLAHHNFFPMGPDRKHRDEREESGAVTYGCPENSMKRLETLFRNKVDIVLHGHRHYDFVLSGEWDTDERNIERSGIIVGCPSTGYYEGETVQPSAHSRAGFRVFDLTKTTSRVRARVKKYALSFDDQWVFNFSYRDINLRRTRGLEEFMEFKEGYGKFVSDTLSPPVDSSHRRVNIYHYHKDTRWADSWQKFWGNKESDAHLIHASLTDNWFQGMIKWQELVDRGYVSIDLGKHTLLKNLDEVIHKTLIFEPPSPKEGRFEKHLRQMVEAAGESARSVTYVAEALLCAAYKDCHVMKHVYICPKDTSETAGKQKIENKFRWLCESLLMVRGLNNFDITWLPFAIRNYNGRSLVGIRKEVNGRDQDVYYVGFDPQPNACSILRLPEENDRTASAEGPILADLKAVIAKVVNPLSHRLLHDFPLIKAGKLYNTHLCAYAKGIKCLKIWEEEYQKKFEDAFGTNIAGEGIQMDEIKKKLSELYSWVSKTGGNGRHIPWESDDMEALEKHFDDKNE